MSTLSKTVYQSHASSPRGFAISCEMFPPRTQRGLFRLLDQAIELYSFSPAFLSVTYGANGSSQERSLKTATALASLEQTPVAGHITAAGQPRAAILKTIDDYLAAGIRDFVAIRGDAGPIGDDAGYSSTAQMVSDLRQRTDGSICVAAYPEKHPRAADWQADIDALSEKFDAGADQAITQFFFDNAHYFNFRERLAKRGIKQPVTPGILLIHDFTKVREFAKRCGTHVPDWVSHRYQGLENDLETQKLVSVGLAIEQVLDLAAQGCTDFHFYTFNRSDLAVAVCRSLGIPIELAEAA